MFIGLENLEQESLLIQEGADDSTVLQAMLELHDAETDINQLLELSETIDNLENLHGSIESFGVTQSLLSFADGNGILSNSFPAFAACESLGSDLSPKSTQAKQAMESIFDKIKDMSAVFFKRSWDMVTNISAKIKEFTLAAFNKITSAAKYATNKVFNAARAAKEFVVAHKVEFAIAAVVACAALVAVFVKRCNNAIGEFDTVTSNIEAEHTEARNQKEQNTTASVKSKWKYKFFNKKGADAEIEKELSAYDAEYKQKMDERDSKRPLSALGYTKEAFSKIVDSGKNFFGSNGVIGKMLETLKATITKLYAAAKGKGTAVSSYTRMQTGELLKFSKEISGKIMHMFRSLYMPVINQFKKLFVAKDAVAA